MKVFGIDVGQIAQMALPFIPGPWGAVAGAGLNMLEAGKEQGKANSVRDGMGGVGQNLLSQYMSNNPAVMQGLLNGSGVGTDARTPEQIQKAEAYETIMKLRGSSNPGDRKMAEAQMKGHGITDADLSKYAEAKAAQYDPNYNPYESVISDTYNPEAIAKRANSYFNPESLYGDFAATEDAIRSPYEGAVRGVEADAARRGTTNSTFTSSATSALRQDQARANTGYRIGQLTDLGNQKRAYAIGQEGVGQQLLTGGIDEARRRLEGVSDTLEGGLDRGIGIMGGMQGAYQSAANNRMGAAGDMLESAAKTMIKPKKTPTVQNPFVIGQPKYTPAPEAINPMRVR